MTTATHAGPDISKAARDASRTEGSSRTAILLVEDHPGVRLTIAQQLEDAGYAVVQVDHGEEALAIIEGADRIDALVTDLRLPGRVDGWDIAEHARRVRPALPVVYVSAFSYVTPRQVPGSIMLDKPAPHDALIGALDDLLG